MEVYEPEHNENVKTNLLGMQGSIEDVYTVVPQFQGKYPIPALDSVSLTRWRRICSFAIKETVIDVYEGPIAATPVQQNSPQIKSPVLNEPTFDFIKLETILQPVGVDTFSVLPILDMDAHPIYSFVDFTDTAKNWLCRSRNSKLAARLTKKYLSSAREN